MTKQVIDQNTNQEITVPLNTPCYAGKNGALPIMYDAILDINIFSEMEARDIQSEIEKTNYIANHKYKDDRKAAYGSIQDQLDMMYWDQVNGTSTWKDHIDIIKLAHPKP